MRVLYSKFNSERNSKFQVKTIIYEENGIRYVKKEALTPEAVAHIDRMKENHSKLSALIVDPKIKLVPIVKESKNSVTFAFIEGESLEKRYLEALKKSNSDAGAIIEEYFDIVKNGFKTRSFTYSPMLDRLFGTRDYSAFEGEPSFDGISNIDLIFSNILFKDNDIYIIDYEWSYDITLPINFIIWRTLSMLPELPKDYISMKSSTIRWSVILLISMLWMVVFTFYGISI